MYVLFFLVFLAFFIGAVRFVTKITRRDFFWVAFISVTALTTVGLFVYNYKSLDAFIVFLLLMVTTTLGVLFTIRRH